MSNADIPKPPVQQVVTNSLMQIGIAWLQGQTFNNVLLAAILGAIGVVSWYGIPAGISQVREWQDSGQKACHEALDRQLKTFESTISRQIEAYERTSDRDYETIRTLMKANHGVELPPAAERKLTASPK